MYTTKETTAANDIKSETRDTLYDVKDDLRDVANRTGKRVRGLVDSAAHEFSQATETVGTQIRTNPVQSSLIALGFGFILGALLRR